LRASRIVWSALRTFGDRKIGVRFDIYVYNYKET
jgi:hypothetical protein